jgi:hypothetical protein
MDYKDLKEIIRNNKNADEEKQVMLFGYIDYCEKTNVNISEAVRTINGSKILIDTVIEMQDWFDINTFMDELELLTKKYNIIIDGCAKLKTIDNDDIFGAEGDLFWNGKCYELR